MKRFIRYFPFLLILLLVVLPAAAKGPVDMITISGPGIDEPIALTDPEILSQFDPWGSQFVGTGGPLETIPNVALRVPYQTFFYLQGNNSELELRYVFYYYPDPDDGRGLIYLPGSGEPYYRINIGTIITQDGSWQYASPGWEAAVQDILQAQGTATSSPTTTGQTPLVATWLLLGAAVGAGMTLLIPGLLRQRRNGRPVGEVARS